MSQPPSTQSVDEMRMKSGSSRGQTPRTARTTSRTMRVRFSKEPPYSSSRSLESGEREFVKQIAVRRMDLGDAKAGEQRAPRGTREGDDDFGDLIARHRVREPDNLRRTQGAGPEDRLPAAFDGIDRLAAEPRNGRARFAAGVRELNAGDGAVVVNEGGDLAQLLDVLVAVDAEVGGADARRRRDGRRFGEDEAGAADGAAAQVDEVPVIGEPVFARVLAHRRNGDAVTSRDAAERQRIEKADIRDL